HLGVAVRFVGTMKERAVEHLFLNEHRFELRQKLLQKLPIRRRNRTRLRRPQQRTHFIPPLKNPLRVTTTRRGGREEVRPLDMLRAVPAAEATPAPPSAKFKLVLTLPRPPHAQQLRRPLQNLMPGVEDRAVNRVEAVLGKVLDVRLGELPESLAE